jgi:hypothetical protein
MQLLKGRIPGCGGLTATFSRFCALISMHPTQGEFVSIFESNFESSSAAPYPTTAANSAPKIRVLATRATKSLSGKCEIAYQLGCDHQKQLHIRLLGTSGRGTFSKYWFSFTNINDILSRIPAHTGVVSRSLQALCFDKNTDTSPFITAALVNEGVLRLIKLAKVEAGAAPKEIERDLNTKRYELCDPVAFKARMDALMDLSPGDDMAVKEAFQRRSFSS